MPARIHLVIEERERDAFRARATSDGETLSEWLREAARQRLARERPATISSVAELDRFFAECSAAEGGVEPDWQQHLEVVERSQRSGIEPT